MLAFLERGRWELFPFTLGRNFQIAHARLELQQLQLLTGQLLAAWAVLRDPLQPQLLLQKLNHGLRILQLLLQLFDDLCVRG